MTDRERLIDLAKQVKHAGMGDLLFGPSRGDRAMVDELDPPPLPYKGIEPQPQLLEPGSWMIQTYSKVHYHLAVTGDTREQAIRRHNACVKALESVA